MKFNEGIQVENVDDCLLCGQKGNLLYKRLRDLLVGIKGQWNLMRCPECRLVWLNPRPVPKEFHALYVNYFTHGLGYKPARRSGILTRFRACFQKREIADTWGYGFSDAHKRHRSAGRTLFLSTFLRDHVGSQIMWLKKQTANELLDVGCGDGKFLAAMRDFGWKVTGVEPDAEAARRAFINFGLDVFKKPLDQLGFPDSRFDVITMSNVLEHLPNALDILKEAMRILKPGGKIVILTPNPESLGHRFFGRNWRGLEPPRHFFIYPPSALCRIVDRVGLTIEELRTTLIGARDIWLESRLLQKRNGVPFSGNQQASNWFQWESYAFYLVEHFCNLAAPMGEQILLIGRKAANS